MKGGDTLRYYIALASVFVELLKGDGKIYVKTCTTSNTIYCWEDINFRLAEKRVKKLQKRIANTWKLGERDKAMSLQHTLIHSVYAKALAVKTVTSKKGKYTPGVDGVLWLTPEDKWQAVQSLNRRGYRPRPLKRIYISKPDGTKRPLSIPTMKDRAMQTLYKMALEPVAEVTADHNSYGFRPARCTRDAIIKCAEALSTNPSPEWILEADIQACFDNISHDWVMKHIPMDPSILKKMLKSSYLHKHRLYPVEKGLPQGGCLSPVICNMVLDGLEKELYNQFQSKVQFIRYADDFIMIGTSRNELAKMVVPAANAFLSQRGLNLANEKTGIVHIKEGFDFLGWNVYRNQDGIQIRPSRKNIEAILNKLEKLFSKDTYKSSDELLKILYPILAGWVNYHRDIVGCSLYHIIIYDLRRMSKGKPIAEQAVSFFG